MSKIFVQIASYKDPQLVPTLNDMFENAANPQDLQVCIAWQKDTDEMIGKYEKHNQVQLIPIPYKESKGACWARNLIQQNYNNEDFTLQLDSHMRFAPNWDKELKDMYQTSYKRGLEKPLLTAYVPSFDPDNDPGSRVKEPWKMKFDRFIPEGAVFFLPESIDEWKSLTAPINARFYSAHFCFTSGKFCKEVPHDPNYYFHGEEISIAARSFTHGYNLLHPHKPLVWHEYTRKNRTKHWDDHIDNKVQKTWWTRNEESHKRNRILFGMEPNMDNIDFGIYGFGKKRSLQDYENYTGINFKLKLAQQFTEENWDVPPNPEIYKTEAEWTAKCTKQYYVSVSVNPVYWNTVDYDFWYVGVHDVNGTEIYRKDFNGEELESIKGRMEFDYRFRTNNVPDSITVWPHSISKGWLEKTVQRLNFKR